jgi:hypothetical protein
MDADQYTEAVAEYGRAILLAPDPESTAMDYVRRGLCQTLLDRYEDALIAGRGGELAELVS